MTDLHLHDERTLLGATVISTFKSDDRSRVELIEHAQHRWVLKRYHGRALKLWLYHLLRLSPAWRECRAAARLQALNLRANIPRPPVNVGPPWRFEQTLVLPYVAGLNLHHWLKQHTKPDARRPVLEAVGCQIGRLTAAGWINRDLKPSNLIIDEACESQSAEPVMIDPMGLRRRRRGGQIVQMLAGFCRAGKRAGLGEAEWRACLQALVRTDSRVAGVGSDQQRANRLFEATRENLGLGAGSEGSGNSTANPGP